MAKKKVESRKLQVTLVKSPIGNPEPQKRTVKALGLRRLHQTVTHDDTPALRGMLDKVRHLIVVVEQD
jgi:large subunit ribosomal protein L30